MKIKIFAMIFVGLFFANTPMLAMEELGRFLAEQEQEQVSQDSLRKSFDSFNKIEKSHYKPRRNLKIDTTSLSRPSSQESQHIQSLQELRPQEHSLLLKDFDKLSEKPLSAQDFHEIKQSLQYFDDLQKTPVLIELNRLERLAKNLSYTTLTQDTALAATITAAGIATKLALHQQTKRIPPLLLATPPILSFLKTQGVNLVVGTSGIYFLYKLNQWIHAPCKAREKEIVTEFKKIAADANKEIHTHFETLQNEVLRQTEQARMNGIDAIVKVDHITDKLSTRVEFLERVVAKTDLKKELIPLKKELADQRKKLDEVSKKKNPQIATILAELDRIQKQLIKAEKSSTAGCPNDAISILAHKVQKLAEDLRQHERGATPTSQASSPATTPRGAASGSGYANGSLLHDFNTHNLSLIVPDASLSRGRRASVSGPVPPLSPVTEHSSSPGLNDSEASGSGEADGNPQITVKPPSPQRRHSFCGISFGSNKGKWKTVA